VPIVHPVKRRSLARDLPRIAGIALLWCVLDALRPRRPKRIVCRLVAAG
jgi:hypothetical protein